MVLVVVEMHDMVSLEEEAFALKVLEVLVVLVENAVLNCVEEKEKGKELEKDNNLDYGKCFDVDVASSKIHYIA